MLIIFFCRTAQHDHIISRLWRMPLGGVNCPVLCLVLEAICMHIMHHPGISVQALAEKFSPALQPVPLLESLEVSLGLCTCPPQVSSHEYSSRNMVIQIVQILETLGCIDRRFVQRNTKANLFSSRSAVTFGKYTLCIFIHSMSWFH